MSPRKTKRSAQDFPLSDPLDNEDDSEPAQISTGLVSLDEPDPLSALFDGLPDSRVQLFRTGPMNYNGEKISGYLCDLDQSCDLSWINANYGGGIYTLRKTVRGRYTQQRTVEIAGRPRLDPPGAAGAAASMAAPMPSAGSRVLANVGADVAYKGIPLTGSNEEFVRMVERLSLIKHYFPEPTNINDTLLKMLLEKQSDTGLDGILKNMEKARELIDRLSPGENGGGETGSILNLIGKGLDTFKALLEKRGTPPAPAPGSAVEPIGFQPVPLPELITERPANVPESNPLPGEKEMPNFREMANQGCSIIVDSFMSEPTDPNPEKLVAITVDMVKMQLPSLTPEIKAEMIRNRAALNGIGRLILNERYEIDPQLVQNFNLFFDQVFDILTSEVKPEKAESNVETSGI